jgi:hypothetical protein
VTSFYPPAVQRITSNDDSVTIGDPTGPITDLTDAGGGSSVPNPLTLSGDTGDNQAVFFAVDGDGDPNGVGFICISTSTGAQIGAVIANNEAPVMNISDGQGDELTLTAEEMTALGRDGSQCGMNLLYETSLGPVPALALKNAAGQIAAYLGATNGQPLYNALNGGDWLTDIDGSIWVWASTGASAGSWVHIT